jgi:hypothetical protein
LPPATQFSGAQNDGPESVEAMIAWARRAERSSDRRTDCGWQQRVCEIRRAAFSVGSQV